MLFTKEHYELIAQFEKSAGKYFRLDKEPKELWKRGQIFQNGEANNAFKMYCEGFAYGRAVERLAA